MKQELSPLQIGIASAVALCVIIVIGVMVFNGNSGAKAPAPGPGNYPGEKARTATWTPPQMQGNAPGGPPPGMPSGTGSPGSGTLTTTP